MRVLRFRHGGGGAGLAGHRRVRGIARDGYPARSKEGKLGAIETVYLGGGTPSHIGMGRLSMLLYALSMSMHLEPEIECTMEANPESLTAPMVRDIWRSG